MIVLALSISISSFLFVIFKLFNQFKVHNLTAIIMNYLVAYSLGAMIEGDTIVIGSFHKPWFWSATALGLLFISLFTLMARITQEQGIGISVLANKMSVILPIAMAFIFLGESIDLVQSLGIVAAIAGIYLTSTKGHRSLSFNDLKWPLVLFIGSGFLDFALKLNQQFLLGNDSFFAFVALVFLAAFVFGTVYSVGTKQLQITSKNVIAGLALGIPNYFSIYFIMAALNLNGIRSTVIFPINNAGILLLSTLLGFLFFKEKLSLKNWLGLGLCLLGIFLIALSF